MLWYDFEPPVEKYDKLLASCSNLWVWMGDGSTAKFGKADHDEDKDDDKYDEEDEDDNEDDGIDHYDRSG